MLSAGRRRGNSRVGRLKFLSLSFPFLFPFPFVSFLLADRSPTRFSLACSQRKKKENRGFRFAPERSSVTNLHDKAVVQLDSTSLSGSSVVGAFRSRIPFIPFTFSSCSRARVILENRPENVCPFPSEREHPRRLCRPSTGNRGL